MTTIQEIKNLETFFLIYLGDSVNNEVQQQLRTIINYLLTFDDEKECFKYIHSLSKNDRVILIVKEKLGQHIIPEIVHLRQIVSIYVYCNDIKNNQQWTKNFTKVNYSYSLIIIFSYRMF
jgi:hypothetical protein